MVDQLKWELKWAFYELKWMSVSFPIANKVPPAPSSDCTTHTPLVFFTVS